MAKNNNLTDFLTDVADAIRSKKGTTAKINPQDFSSEIASIETGGGGTTGGAVSKSDVNFYDCDGTLLHSYTKDDFLALSALPDLPTRKGLICQEWNYNLDDAKEYVTDYGVLDIGATYITDDGKTRLYIKIAAKGRMTVPLYFSQTVLDGVTIDWGDGSANQTLSGTGNVNTSHTYADIGEYVISLNPASGCTLGLGHGSSSYCVMGDTGNNGRVYCNMLQAVEIGKNLTSISNYTFNNCYSLASVVIPKGVTSISNYTFYYCYSLASVVIPKGVTKTGVSTFHYCYSLASVVIPKGVTNIDGGTFNNCYSLASVVIPKGVTKIDINVFRSCYSLASVVIPKGVTNIDLTAFSYCYGMAYYDFRASTSVPKLESSAFNYIPSDCKIVVPDSLYDSWISATNWSTYASKIVKASEFNG